MSIILKKNESSNLTTENGKPILNLSIGCNWGMISQLGSGKAAGFLDRLASKLGVSDTIKTAVDLDLSIVFADDKGKYVDMCYFGKKTLFSGAVKHLGDDLVGDSEKNEDDNELIQFEGMKIPLNVKTAIVLLNSFRHQKFDEIPYIGISFYEGLVNRGSKGLRFAESRVEKEKEAVGKESCILAKVTRKANGWEVTPLFDYVDKTNLHSLADEAVHKYA